MLMALDDPAGAVVHAERALALEGDGPRALSMLARALAATGRKPEARDAAMRALALQPQAEDVKALLAELSKNASERGWGARVLGTWKKWRRK